MALALMVQGFSCSCGVACVSRPNMVSLELMSKSSISTSPPTTASRVVDPACPIEGSRAVPCESGSKRLRIGNRPKGRRLWERIGIRSLGCDSRGPEFGLKHPANWFRSSRLGSSDV
jgi:hypothetical protein